MEDFFYIGIILIHFLADFGLQTHEQATLKSTNIKQLLYHVGIYSLVWFIAVLPFGLGVALQFVVITFWCHFTTDWLTSRIGKPFWEKKDLHNGFVIIGFDQMLHYIQLYYTFKFLFL